MDQRQAKLRVCASCEFVFENHDSCPMCGFAHYGARSVYGDKCYKYKKTRQPGIDKKVLSYLDELQKQIAKKCIR